MKHFFFVLDIYSFPFTLLVSEDAFGKHQFRIFLYLWYLCELEKDKAMGSKLIFAFIPTIQILTSKKSEGFLFSFEGDQKQSNCE